MELKYAMRFLVEKGCIKRVIFNPKTQNIVVKVDFEVYVNLEELALRVKGVYEPEQFPAFILRVYKPYSASILIFASGKAVIAGLKSSKQIEPTIQKLKEIILLVSSPDC